MKFFVPALLVGLVAGGAAGWFAAGMRSNRGDAGDALSVAGKLDEIESRIRDMEDRSAPGETGLTAPSTNQPLRGAADVNTEELTRRLNELLSARLGKAMDAHLETRGLPKEKSFGDWLEENRPLGSNTQAREKKKVTLAEVARELEMTQSEEEAIRELAEEFSDKMIGLLTTEDETKEQVIEELQAAKDDPTKQMALMGKYMGRAMTNLPKLMETMGSLQTRGVKILGAERWGKFERDYEVTDLDPYGLTGIFDND